MVRLVKDVPWTGQTDLVKDWSGMVRLVRLVRLTWSGMVRLVKDVPWTGQTEPSMEARYPSRQHAPHRVSRALRRNAREKKSRKKNNFQRTLTVF